MALETMEYKHIMAVLDRDGGFGQNHSDPAFYVRSPRLKREARHATSSPKRTSTAGRMLISLERNDPATSIISSVKAPDL